MHKGSLHFLYLSANMLHDLGGKLKSDFPFIIELKMDFTQWNVWLLSVIIVSFFNIHLP